MPLWRHLAIGWISPMHVPSSRLFTPPLSVYSLNKRDRSTEDQPSASSPSWQAH